MSDRLEPRRIPLHRAVCTIEADRMTVRPSRGSILPPLVGLLAGLAGLVSILLWTGALPFPLLALLLTGALLIIPLSGVGLVYSIGGARVVLDRRKGSAAWQQGLLGMGVGTREVTPFEKIAHVLVEETTAERLQGQRQDVAQWEIAVVRNDGRRLTVGAVTVPRPLARDGLDRAREVADAIAAMTGAPLSLPASRRRRRRRTSPAGV
jgi:hypothetical protein